MVVTWVTEGKVHDSAKVEFGKSHSDLKHHVKAEETHVQEEQTEFHTFRALLTGLKPDTTYCKKLS